MLHDEQEHDLAGLGSTDADGQTAEPSGEPGSPQRVPRTMIGRVEFAGGVVGIVTAVRLRCGQIEFAVDVPRPHAEFNVHLWRLIGEDGALIAMASESEERSERLSALPRDGGTTTVYLPLAVSAPGGRVDAIGPAR